MYYKFRLCNENNFLALENMSVYFSSFSDLNDPFEGTFSQRKDLGDNLYGKISRRLISCFSKGDTDFVKTSHLLWTFYADAHKGFCIEYNDQVLEGYKTYEDVKNIQENVWMEISYTHAFQDPIDYGDDVERCIADVIKHKSKDYEFENEVRLVNHTSKPGGRCMAVPKNSINAIYLGCRISLENKQRLMGIANLIGVPCYQMSMDNATYILDAKEV